MAIASKSPENMFELGKKFYTTSSEASDQVMAMEYFLEAAEADYIPAQRILGNCYLEGRHGQPNYQEAHKWLAKASRQNDGQATFSLARMYVFGLGVPQDWGMGYKLLDMGCARSLEASRALKKHMKETLYKKFPNIITAFNAIEKQKRCVYDSYSQRFIQPWDTLKSPQLDWEEFDIWLKLSSNVMTAEQGLEALTVLLNAHYKEQEAMVVSSQELP